MTGTDKTRFICPKMLNVLYCSGKIITNKFFNRTVVDLLEFFTTIRKLIGDSKMYSPGWHVQGFFVKVA